MNSWLEPSIIATLVVTIIMFMSFSYLYYQEKAKALKYFSIAWLVYLFRFIVRLVNIHYPIPQISEIINYLSDFLNCGFLLIGIYLISNKWKKYSVFIILCISLALLSLLYISGVNQFYRTTIAFIISGSCYIYIGFKLFKLRYRNKIFFIIGINFILWGIHKYDYPFLYNSAIFAPIGYFLAVLFSIVAAQGFHILYYNTARSELRNDKDRLDSLLNVIKIDNIELLLDEALSIALKLTKSEYGYIYHYSEELQEFKLNTWSKDVHKDCTVTEKSTIYKLSATGCWGEAVRQRKPFISNNYKADKVYRKGTPEGHVDIKKFLTIPYFTGNEIVAVIGVANKKEDYNTDDVRQLSLLMNNVWKIVEIKEYQHELQEAKIKAEESNKLKSAFLSNISHELRTPLNGTLGMLSLVRLSDNLEKAKQFSDLAYKSSHDMLYLVEEILSFSNYSTKQIKPIFSKFNLIEDIINLVEVIQIDASNKNLTIQLDYDSDVIEIENDKSKINQIIINLLDNAIKFTDIDGGIINIIVKKNNHITITIEDNGVGIPEDKLGLIFEPFHQLEDPYTKTHKGIGAGLAIVKSLCELLNITIDFVSKINQGTIVTLIFN